LAACHLPGNHQWFTDSISSPRTHHSRAVARWHTRPDSRYCHYTPASVTSQETQNKPLPPAPASPSKAASTPKISQPFPNFNFSRRARQVYAYRYAFPNSREKQRRRRRRRTEEATPFICTTRRRDHQEGGECAIENRTCEIGCKRTILDFLMLGRVRK